MGTIRYILEKFYRNVSSKSLRKSPKGKNEKTNFLFTAPMDRTRLGLPSEWKTVQEWLEGGLVTEIISQDRTSMMSKKVPELEVLADYKQDPAPRFWKRFPKFSPKEFVPGPVIVDWLEQITRICWGKWDQQQKKDAKTVLKILRQGAKCFA